MCRAVPGNSLPAFTSLAFIVSFVEEISVGFILSNVDFTGVIRRGRSISFTARKCRLSTVSRSRTEYQYHRSHQAYSLMIEHQSFAVVCAAPPLFAHTTAASHRSQSQRGWLASRSQNMRNKGHHANVYYRNKCHAYYRRCFLYENISRETASLLCIAAAIATVQD